MMQIRVATLDDEEQIADLTARFIAEEHGYRRVLAFDADKIGETLRGVLQVGVVLVVDVGGRLAGLLAGAAVQSLSSREVYFDEVLWYVEPEWRKSRAGYYLLRDAIRWAQANGCSSVKIGAPAGSDLGTFLERNAFHPVETAYQLRIDEWPPLRRSGSGSSSGPPPEERLQR